MSTITRIRKQAVAFYVATGKKPTRVYIGSACWFGLANELKGLGMDANPLHLPGEGARIDGMHITLTQGGEWHIGFSYDEKDAV